MIDKNPKNSLKRLAAFWISFALSVIGTRTDNYTSFEFVASLCLVYFLLKDVWEVK